MKRTDVVGWIIIWDYLNLDFISHRVHKELRELKNNIKKVNGQIMDFGIASKLDEVCPSEKKACSFAFSSEGPPHRS